MINDKYLESVQFIESLINNPGPNYLQHSAKKDRSFFIKRLQYLLNLLGNPEKNFKYIHIAGTSGKSSLACMLQSILTQAGLKTGAYFSPHPTETFERIKIGNKYISKNDFAKITDILKPHLSRCAQKSPHGIPSYFETLLALSLLYFQKQKCQYVILEAGLGGTFDATNIIPRPEIAIITKIDLDHTDILGKTKQKIARDKAGIIKKGTTVITAEQDPKILKIFQKICKEKKCQFHKIDFDYKLLKNNLTGTKFKYPAGAGVPTRTISDKANATNKIKKSPKQVSNIYQTRLPGEHQIKNAILAIETIKQSLKHKNIKTLKQYGNITIRQSTIKSGLANAFLPCRLEVIQRNPVVILDGAHNPDKMKSTAEFIRKISTGTTTLTTNAGAGLPKGLELCRKLTCTKSDKAKSKNNKKTNPQFSNRRLHLILALAENKDLYNTLKYIVPLADHIYLTRFLIPGRKSQSLKKMYQIAQKLTSHKVGTYIDPWQALNKALHNARKSDIVLVTGSFFLAGELRKHWLYKQKYSPKINSNN